MALAISMCGSALATQASAEPLSAFGASQPFTTAYGSSEPVFNSPQCIEATQSNEYKREFFLWVYPANDEVAMLLRFEDTFPPEGNPNNKVGILNCEEDETSWVSSRSVDRLQHPDIELSADSDRFTEALEVYLADMKSDSMIEISSAPNNVGQTCICSFLASEAWQQYKQNFIADPSNYSAGGN